MDEGTLLKLAARARAGDRPAQTAILNQFQPFVAGLAGRLHKSNPSIPRDELQQEGSVGLLHALYTFKPDKKAKLSTYVIGCVKNAMLMAVRTHQHTSKRFVTVDDVPDMESAEPDPVQVCLQKQDISRVRAVLKQNRLDASRLALLQQRLMSDSPEALERLGKRFGVTGECLRKREIALKALLRRQLRVKRG